MKFRSIDSRVLAGLAVSSFMIVVAGCQSGDSGGTAAQPKVSATELRAYCPTVSLREGTAFLNSYAKGGQDDPAKLLYQASISDVTRSCSRADGMLTLNVAVAGKVVSGPAGGPGKVTLPVRVVVVRGQEVLYSKLQPHEITVADPAAATQFVVNDQNVTFPIPEEGSVQVFAGFDEGAPVKAKGKGKGKK
ncbi:hypothetical protein M2281_000740 [Mesorhizobium soli]|uniref:hypothetical protein n=1 Tax=Pseudaminobacter soli (ex Li et al. 2025) TaxID=1295366 RepID=UPI002473D629|nr:hypothetical protein [Mesorhizobium soli]MDH6230168.1 hypothetical protein [Mesorhizobium soli]